MQRIRWKKNLLGYLLWLVLCCMVCCIFVITGTEILAGVGVEKVGASIGMMCVFAVAEIHIFFRIDGAREEKGQSGRKGWPGIALAVLLMAVLRTLAAVRWGLEPVDRTFFEMAEVTGEFFLPLTAHKASFVYFCFLSVLFRFFGNRWEIIVGMQLLMQTGVCLLLGLAVRKLMGRTAAFWFLIFSAVSPGLLLHYREISPDLLLCLLLGAVLLAAASLFSVTQKGNWGRIALAGCFAGILAGVCTWLDLWGITALLAILIGVLQLDEKGCTGEKSVALFCLLAGFFGSMGAIFGAEGSVAERGYRELWQQYISSYLERIGPPIWEPLYGFELIGLFLASMLAGMAVIGFFRQKYEKTAVVTVLLLGYFVIRTINMTQVSYINLGNFLFLLAACTGVQCLADRWESGKESRAVCPGAEETGILEEKAERGGEEVNRKESEMENRETVQESKDSGYLEKGSTEKGKEESAVTQDGGAEKEIGENSGPKQGIQYIPNPLPVPKRHVKKEIAFDYEPEPSQMKFDRELQPGEDDFDI